MILKDMSFKPTVLTIRRLTVAVQTACRLGISHRPATTRMPLDHNRCALDFVTALVFLSLIPIPLHVSVSPLNRVSNKDVCKSIAASYINCFAFVLFVVVDSACLDKMCFVSNAA